MDEERLEQLLRQFQEGLLSIEQMLDQVQSGLDLSKEPARSARTEDACVDLDRQRRCGYPEVVYAEGKTPAGLAEIFTRLIKAGQAPLATRVSPEQARVIDEEFPGVRYNPVARTLRMPEAHRELRGRVAVITAGTTDRPIAEEAVETLHWMGCEVELIQDVGVAGPHRLVEQRARFQDADVIIVVAGMEGALPSVVGGHVAVPVIAVPTSVGYGASFQGLAALLGMLNSCAANVTVVNIDGGFKGGYVAGLVARGRGE